MRCAAGAAVALAAAGSLGGCIASNVVAAEDRLVATAPADLQWVAAPGRALEGLYESVEIRGDAAVSLRRVYYLFGPENAYTAAALIEADGASAFQAHSGTWQWVDGKLALDDQPPVLLEHAEEHLRLTTPTWVLVLRRSRLQ
jgi:hypothetical protein